MSPSVSQCEPGSLLLPKVVSAAKKECCQDLNAAATLFGNKLKS